MKKPLITVWIPTYNRGESLKRALMSLVLQTTSDFIVYVYVDNTEGAADRVMNICETELRLLEFKGVKWRVYGSTTGNNEGICYAKNQLLNFTDTEWFLYLEDDAVLAGNFLSTLNTAIIANRYFMNLGGIAGVQQIVGVDENEVGFDDTALVRKKNSSDEYWNSFKIENDKVVFDNKDQMHHYSKDCKMRVEAMCFIHTYCLNTKAVKENGGWDMIFNFPYYSFEEIDVTYALFKQDKKLFVLPYLEMFHIRSHGERKRVDYTSAYLAHEQLFIKKWRN